MSESPSAPDRDLDPDPAGTSSEHPDTPRHPPTDSGVASEKPDPGEADEGKNPEDISPAQVV